MGDVYATAEEVWVWLGSDALKPLIGRPLATLKWLRDLGRTAEGGKLERDEDGALHIEHGAKLEDLCYLEEYIPWFMRIWVLQEVVFGRRVKLFRDSIILDYEEIILASKLVSSSPPRTTALLHRHCLLKTFELFYSLEESKSEPRSLSRLDSITEFMRSYLSTDARDKVFGLHALLVATGLSLPPPDYNKAVATVYKETTKKIMLFTNSLASLKQLTGLEERLELSSWSPDWSASRYPFNPCPAEGQMWQASGNSTPTFSFLDNETLLSCEGTVLDTISATSVFAMAHSFENRPVLQPPENYLTWSRNLHPQEFFWLDALKVAPHLSEVILSVYNVHVLQRFLAFASTTADGLCMEEVYQDLQSCMFSYKRTLGKLTIIEDAKSWDGWLQSIMGAVFEDETQPDQFAEQVEEGRKEPNSVMGQVEISVLHRNKSILESSKASTLLRTAAFAAWERVCNDQNQAGLHRAIVKTTKYQALFRTRLSKSLGMAPHSIREGDQVILLSGLDVPMIIRPLESGHHRIIAPAYICGIMEGQAWEQHRGSEDGLQDLVFE